jgi:N-carbamoyl-L-amino-acid hydrolase
MNVEIHEDQLDAELSTLASFSAGPPPGVTRIVFSEADVEARAYVKGLCADAGLSVREDAIGNTFARWHADAPDLPAVATGSHIDAIPHSGSYDGTVGVLGAIEAIRALQRSGFRPRRSIELLLFTAEEPTRFGIGCLGSRMIAQALKTDALDRLRDADGRTVDEVRLSAGFQGPLESVALLPNAYNAFLELHIEQGPLLERERVPIGVVTHIAAPAGLRILVSGEGGHAGAVLMPDRRDAFLAAAEIALAVERAALATGALDTVATVGICDILPRAVNSIPSSARLEVDVRDIDPARRDQALDAIRAAARKISARRRVEVRTELVNADAPAKCDPAAVVAITDVCRARGIGCLPMISRAYHDSLFMSRICPVAMIFIPCRGGVSHRPDEYAAPEDIACGVTVLAHALARLAG